MTINKALLAAVTSVVMIGAAAVASTRQHDPAQPLVTSIFTADPSAHVDPSPSANGLSAPSHR